MSYTFRLTLRDGDDAGDFVTAVPGPWKIGETFQTGSGFRYRLIDYLPVPEGWCVRRAMDGRTDRTGLTFTLRPPMNLARQRDAGTGADRSGLLALVHAEMDDRSTRRGMIVDPDDERHAPRRARQHAS